MRKAERGCRLERRDWLAERRSAAPAEVCRRNVFLELRRYSGSMSRHMSVGSSASLSRLRRAGAERQSSPPRGPRGISAPFSLDRTKADPEWMAEAPPAGSSGSAIYSTGRSVSPPGMSRSLRGAPLVPYGGGGALPADQRGWRPESDEEHARGQTFREWARDHAGRTDLEDPGGTVIGADIVPGMWTCCRALDPAAGGCVLTGHCLGDEPWDSLPCDRCGAWVELGRWEVDKCYHHPGELQRSRWGGLVWGCCGTAGVAGTKADLVSPARWMMRMERSHERRLAAGRRRQTAALGTSAASLSASRAEGRDFATAATGLCHQPAPSADESAGCALAQRHAFALESHLALGIDGQPLRPACPSCGEPAAMGQKACPQCNEAQRVCVQCFKVRYAAPAAYRPPR